MGEIFRSLFDTNFMPHVNCLRDPGVVWLHAASDTLIAVAYLIIPLGLLRLLGLRKDLKFRLIFVLFAAFILSCGATHIMAIVTLWTPLYRLEGVMKAATALISLATAFLFIRLIPEIAKIPSLTQWRRTMDTLQAEVAERKLAQEKAELLSAIVAGSEDAILSRTLEGTLTSWNAGAERLFGYSAEEAIGRNISLIVPPERAGDEAYLDYVRASKKVEHFETLRMHKDGHRIEVSLIESPIRDAGGNIAGVSKILRDIGELKRAEEKFRLLVESAPNAIVMINRAGGIALVNARAEEWFGYTREEMVGKPVEMLLPERFRSQHAGHRTGFFTKPTMVGPTERAMGLGRDLFALRKDGSEFPIEVGLNPIQTDEGTMVLSAIVDVTKRKQMEENIREFNRILESQVQERTAQLRDANRELEEFAYAASHDLKAPLRVIDNCSKWIEEDLEEHLTDDTRENINLMRGRVKRMNKLLDDLLEYARIGRAADARYAETISGETMMKDVLELLAPPRAFRVNVSPNFARIQVNAMPLEQILANLIGNAVKHHDKDHGCIDITVEERGGLYVFAVKDDGPGIPARFHDQIFKMFQTLRPRDQVEGSGMGLAMVRKHVMLFGGTLDLESREGHGSTFRFTWPKQQSIRKEAV
jgi:PAS domain S-box-containing protein